MDDGQTMSSAVAASRAESMMPRDVHVTGVTVAMERLAVVVDRLISLVPSLDHRLTDVLTEGGVLSSPRPDDPRPPRCGLAAVIESRVDQLDEIAQAVENIIVRVDL